MGGRRDITDLLALHCWKTSLSIKRILDLLAPKVEPSGKTLFLTYPNFELL